jgi:hypothetical protein
MRDTRDRYGLGALLLYLALSCLFFGRGLIGHFYTFHIGEGADPPLMMWFLAWWPHAIANHLNPFLTHAYWAPAGFNITWSTSIPLISLVAAPITAILGPVASLNIFCLLSLPVAAWCTFFLCRLLNNDYWGSTLGGYIFGFCPMLLGQMLFGRLHSLWVFPVPLAIYLVTRRLGTRITAQRFLILLALILIVQFLCSPEIFVTMTLFGAIAVTVAWVQASSEIRERLADTIVSIVCSYIIVLLVVSPYLYYMFFSYRPYNSSIWNSTMLSADVLNLVVPSPINELGRIPFFDWVSGPFNLGVPTEEVAFMSWPLVVIGILFGCRYFREAQGRLLVDCLIIIVLSSLGPFLVVRGHPTKVALPWIIASKTLLNNAAPARFSMYVFLIFAIMIGSWMSTVRAKYYVKGFIVIAIVACQLPNSSAEFWAYQTRTPEFIRAGLYQKYLTKDETIFIFPIWPRNESMLWQAQTHMYFNMAQGPGAWPSKVAIWPIADAFFWQTFVPDASEQFRAYLSNHGVNAVIVDDHSLPTWGRLVSSLGVDPVRSGGVSFYAFPSRSTAGAAPRLHEMRMRFDGDRFELLLIALQKYLSAGGNPNDLLASHLDKLDLIPADSIIGPPAPPELRVPEKNWWRAANFKYGIYLFVTDDHRIALGERAWQPAAKKLIETYRRTATEADFVLSPDSTAPESDQVGVVVMSFTRQQLAKAAAIANASLLKERDAKNETAEGHTER